MNSRCSLRIVLNVLIVSCTGVLTTSGVEASAQDAAAPTFESIRQRHVRAAFDEVAAYVAANPDAPDAAAAHRFLFESALEHDLIREAKPAAERFLAGHAEASAQDRSLARQVAMFALALDGQAEAALDVFGEELAAVRRLDPSAAIDSGTRLAAAVQRGGRPELARDVYERLRRTFLLNAGVEAIVENRLARLEMLGKPAPELGMSDLNGKPAAADDRSGKIVLIDFWATNCPPCLEELPELKRLLADHQHQGFEILAVSLDEKEDTVRDYLDRTELPWRVFLSTADGDATREAYRVEMIPANFLVGADGNVARVDLHGADLRAEVERMVKERTGEPRK